MPETDLRDSTRGLAYVEELFHSFDRNETEIERIVDLGPDTAAFVVRHHVRGAISGAEARRREVHLWRMSDGGPISLREFLTLEEAVEAAG
jgi:ketosteroid isomerase-like protein